MKASDDVQLQLPCRRRRVNAFSQTHERDAKCLEIIQKCNQVLEIASKAIESPADENIKLPSSSLDDKMIERWPSILRAAHPSIDKLHDRPSASFGVASELLQLVLWLLIERADACIDRRPHPTPRFDVQHGAPVPRDQWRSLNMEDQFDAVLYLGPRSTITVAPRHLSPELCADPEFLPKRLARLALTGLPPIEAERLKQLCQSPQ